VPVIDGYDCGCVVWDVLALTPPHNKSWGEKTPTQQAGKGTKEASDTDERLLTSGIQYHPQRSYSETMKMSSINLNRHKVAKNILLRLTNTTHNLVQKAFAVVEIHCITLP